MEWYIYRNGKQEGPISEEELFQSAAQGNIGKNDFVWNHEMKDWTPADRIPGLVGAGTTTAERSVVSDEPSKELMINEILQLNNAGPFSIIRGIDTDIQVTNEVTDSSWFSGKKKVTYSARILLNENDKTAYYWEMLKESSSGLSFKVGVEKRKVKGIELFQQSREKGYAPGGELVYDYQFEYGTLREAFKHFFENHGWKFKVVLMKGKTNY